jgi:hypothetical protein
MLVPLCTNGHKNIKAQYNARLTFVGGTDDNRWIDLSNVATSQFLCRFVQEHGKSIHRLSAFCRTAPLKSPVLAEKRGLMGYELKQEMGYEPKQEMGYEPKHNPLRGTIEGTLRHKSSPNTAQIVKDPCDMTRGTPSVRTTIFAAIKHT